MRRSRRVCLTSLLVSALAFVGPALADSVPTFQDGGDEAPQSRGELFFVVQELRQEVRRLQGQVEEQSAQIERLNRQGRERYVDLDERLLELSSRLSELEDRGVSESRGDRERSNLEHGGSGSLIASTSDDGVARNQRDYRQPDDDERNAYAQIQTLIHDDRDYSAAIDAIYDFLDEYEEGDLTVNAYYWLGEVYLAEDSLEQSKQAFRVVTSRYDDHRKAPDALYKLGVIHDREGDQEQAQRFMQEILDDYSGSDAEALAQDYLDNL